MAYLLDTHALIWWWTGANRLPARIRTLIEDANSSIWVSAASAWEIATKVRSGRLPEMAAHIREFDLGVTGDGFEHLDVRYNHGALAGSMSGSHRDPFDRLLAAQAIIEELTVIARDAEFRGFGCETVW